MKIIQQSWGSGAPCLMEFPLSPTERQFLIVIGSHALHGMTSSAPLEVMRTQYWNFVILESACIIDQGPWSPIQADCYTMVYQLLKMSGYVMLIGCEIAYMK